MKGLGTTPGKLAAAALLSVAACAGSAQLGADGIEFSSFSPTSGPAGSSVVLVGVNFDPMPSKNVVQFNGAAAAVTAASSTSLTAIVPADATTGRITIAAAGKIATSSSDFTITATSADPAISSFSPTSGPIGTSVTISGANFDPAPFKNTVRFNGAAAAVTAASSSSLTAIVPADATTGRITIAAAGKTATSSSDFTVTATSADPAISSFSPTSGPAGISVTISGANFDPAPSKNTVRFNGAAAAVTAASSSSLTAIVPADATTGRITVALAGKIATSTSNFVVTPTSDPAISSFSPTSGPAGISVTISGANFDPTPSKNAVQFNGTAAAVTAASSTSLTAIVPADATTGRITIAIAGKTATSSSDFTVTATSADPAISSFSPTSGPAGISVIISGTNFDPAPSKNTVRFHGAAAAVTAASSSSLTATVPAEATTGRITVAVAGKVATSASDFTVRSGPAPTLRIVERLNRGVVAVVTGGGKAFVSWRLLGNEPAATAFNLYRVVGANSPVLLNTSGPLTSKTNWADSGLSSSQATQYVVKAVVDGKEESTGESYVLPAGVPARQYLPIKLAALASTTGGSYSVLHVYVGDLDGDGDYEYVVKRLDSNRGPIVVDAYELDGTLLWRVNLGPNVETGNSTATSPVLVADFDGDGRAEVVLKTGEGTAFNDGVQIGDTDGDGKTDYNSHNSNDTYQVLTGPEFISVLAGASGTELARVPFIERGQSTDWGDNYGHRMNFIFATVAYLDGVNPSFVMSRGDGELDHPKALTARAWSFRGGKITPLWNWTAKAYEGKLPSGEYLSDFHAIRAMDLDGDGKDEISWGGFVLGSGGQLLHSSSLTHGDRFIIADIDPDRPGLEEYAIQQNNPTLLAAALLDARTGQVLQSYHLTAAGDVGRGEAAAIVPGQRGLQTWNSSLAGLYSASGAQVSSASPFPSLSLWWDGDLLRESLDGIGSSGYNPAIQKWNNSTGKLDRLFTVYNDGGSYAVICPYAGRVPLYGDLLGDWREEVVLETADHSELRIYTTTVPTDYRMPTLMHNPTYRNTVNVKGYLQSTQVDYYLGEGMVFPVPQPAIGVR